MLYGDKPLLDGEAIVAIDSESSACKSDKDSLQHHYSNHDDNKHRVSRNSLENVELNERGCTY